MRYYVAVELNDIVTLASLSIEIKRVIERYLNDI
jgi:hypothetical protein